MASTIKNSMIEMEKIGLISRHPKPIYPFILTIIIFSFWIIVKKTNLDQSNYLAPALLWLSLFSLVFSILHLLVVKILTKK